jgi:flagellar motor switch protein FliM
MLSQEEIDSLINTMSTGVEAPPAAVLPAGMGASAGQGVSPAAAEVPFVDNRNCKLYNFRRPDKFSKDHLRALQTIHEGFARQLSMVLTGYLRMPIDIEVISVDQLTYDEFIHSMPNPMLVSVVEMNPMPGQALLGFSHEVTSGLIDRMLGGPGNAESRPRELTDIEQQLIRRVINRSIATLQESWSSVVEVTTKLVGLEESYVLIQVATPGEIVALVTLQVSFGKQEFGLISFCLPYPVLEGVIDQLSAQHIFHGGARTHTESEQEKVLARLNQAKIPVSVLLGGTKIHVNDLIELQVGDVIRLNRSITDDLLVCVNNQPKFFGKPGTRHKKLAALTTGPLSEEDSTSSKLMEGFGLHGR